MKIFKSILLFALISIISRASGQLQRSVQFSTINGLCSKMIILDSLGLFFMERGCEGSSHIAFGKYKILKNNIVHFQFQPFDSIKPIREINRHQHKRDSSVMISFYDRNEQPLTFCSIEVVDINGKVTNLFTDIKGQVVFKQRQYKQIMLASIPAIFSKAEYIVVGDETSIEVHLALPDLFLIYPDIAVENYEDFQMIIKKDGLYDLEKKTLIYKFSK